MSKNEEDFMFNVTLRNKKDGEVISTDEHGVVAQVYWNADGSYELDEVGTINNISSNSEQDTNEKYFNPTDYELVACHFELPLSRRKFLLSKEEIIRELKPLLLDAKDLYHLEDLNIDSVNGFYVTLLSEDEEKELLAALKDMDFIIDIYPRGHFLSDQQNWRITFIPMDSNEEFKTLSSMTVTDIHEGIEEVLDRGKVFDSTPYGKFLHNNNIDGLGKYLICSDVIMDNNKILEIDLVDKKGNSQLVSYKHLENNDVTLITDKFVPVKDINQLIHKFRYMIKLQLSQFNHGHKITLDNGQKGIIIGTVSHSSTWGCFTVAMIEDFRIIYFDGGDVAHGIVKLNKDDHVISSFDEVKVGNEMAEVLFLNKNSSYVQNTIGA